MKRNLTIIGIGLILLFGSIAVYSLTQNTNATCDPKGKCTACKNCKSCKNCAKNGGKCSVCK